MPVPFDIAVRGGAVNVPLMAGKTVKLTIPAGARTGQQFRLRGKGMPVLRARKFGDLYVQIEVETPTGLTRDQKKHFEAFADSLDAGNYPDMADFNARAKKLTQSDRAAPRTLLHTKPMRLIVNGCAGRMGRVLVRLIAAQDGVELAGGLEAAGSAALGQDLGILAGGEKLGLTASDDALALLNQADGVIDFTTPAATVELAALAAQARLVHIIGTTGCDAAEDAQIAAAARHARIVKSGNMSLGVNMLARLVRQAAAQLDDDWDIEIVDMHHRHKVDAPSGTALLLGEAAAVGSRRQP